MRDFIVASVLVAVVGCGSPAVVTVPVTVPVQQAKVPPVVAKQEQPKFKEFEKKEELKPAPEPVKEPPVFPIKLLMKELAKGERSNDAILEDYIGKDFTLEVTVAIFTPESTALCVYDGQPMELQMPKSAKVMQTYKVVARLIAYNQLEDRPWIFKVLTK